MIQNWQFRRCGMTLLLNVLYTFWKSLHLFGGSVHQHKKSKRKKGENNSTNRRGSRAGAIIIVGNAERTPERGEIIAALKR